jgi:hypothetical protein
MKFEIGDKVEIRKNKLRREWHRGTITSRLHWWPIYRVARDKTSIMSQSESYYVPEKDLILIHPLIQLAEEASDVI